MQCCDFHTHHPSGNHPELLSTPEITASAPYRSLEYHPWHLPENFSPIPENFAYALPRFNALGEVGLDRLRGPELEVQMQFLNALLALAQDCRKPVILHVVRALPELFSLLKRYRVTWVIHGFRGTPDALTEIWKRNGIVSFHKSILSRQDVLTLLRAPQGKFGFETDDDKTLDLPDFISCAARLSGNSKLADESCTTFGELFNE